MTASLSVRSLRTLALAFLATKEMVELNKNGQSKKIIRQSFRHSISVLFVCLLCMCVGVGVTGAHAITHVNQKFFLISAFKCYGMS